LAGTINCVSGGNANVNSSGGDQHVLLHCAKSYRPFELFANENYELQNKAKMNVMFERGSARDPWRGSLFFCAMFFVAGE